MVIALVCQVSVARLATAVYRSSYSGYSCGQRGTMRPTTWRIRNIQEMTDTADHYGLHVSVGQPTGGRAQSLSVWP
jgi:hypothetical protein